MRKLVEPSCRNLLRRPLVLGVSFFGLLSLSSLVMAVQFFGLNTRFGNLIAIGVGTLGYGLLRFITFVARPGWEEGWIFGVEKIFQRKIDNPVKLRFSAVRFPLLSPDTLDEPRFLQSKLGILETLERLKNHQRWTVVFQVENTGTSAQEVTVTGDADLRPARKGMALSENSLIALTEKTLGGAALDKSFAYSLVDIPVITDPLWLSAQLQRINDPFQVVISAEGLDPGSVKAQVDASRRRNAQSTGLSDVDNDVAFDEATRVLQGLSRGDECLVELSLVIISQTKLDLDTRYFFREKYPVFSVASTLGLRKRFHRSHWIRAVTASDLMPNLMDPKEPGTSVLKTARERALYFDPKDPRFPALHWLVVGGTGSGKSFFVGLILLRMVQLHMPISVLFIDHNRSFRRVLRRFSRYFEPKNHAETQGSTEKIFDALNQCGGMAGIELSDLNMMEKKESIHWLLNQVEHFLRTRGTTHTVYVVMDECWNFIRDEPVLVQRFFREFRKLNGAAIAITQSLSDFLTDDSGKSICQNAPIRILLRQDEDVTPYRGVLGLNDVEVERLRGLRQEKGLFSECLIKTPFDSKLARLYPTSEEYELLRTDNIREEMILEERNRQLEELSIRKEIQCGGI